MQLFKALLCQLAAGALVVLPYGYTGLSSHAGGWMLLAQPAAAAVFSRWLRQPCWWLPIHLFFMPAVWVMSIVSLPAWLYLSAFLLTLLLFWGTAKGDVPLFLSSPQVSDALAEIIKREQAASLIELGAGLGSVAVPLAKRLPALRITAVEKAPLPWMILRWRCRRLHNVSVERRSLWDCDLGEYALAFAFLSPIVMARIGEKCRQELHPAHLFVSSSFIIPGWTAESEVVLADRRNTRLYCYRMPDGHQTANGGL